ncbi:MAG TPA: cytochrome P450 [Methylomirabilota bacterium]|nr:cytochrome P450 [Methylomirabilota bacterium]
MSGAPPAAAGGVEAPGPPGLPRVGHLRAFLRDKLGFLAASAATYGDVVRLELGAPTYLVSHPDDLRYILLSNSDNYAKTHRIVGRRGRRFFGDGIVTVGGLAHQRQRRLLQPAFHKDAIEPFAALMVREAETRLARWRDGAEVDLNADILDLTQRIMMRVLLSRESEAEVARFARAINQRRRHQEYLLGRVFPIPDAVPTRSNRAYRRASREIDAIIAGAVRRRRDAGPEPGDMLSMLVHARYDDGSGMSDRQIRDEARTLAIGGYETLAEALCWTWYALAMSPAAEATMAVEAAALPADRPPGVADLPRLGYCRMALAEGMRLYPPTWIFVRVAQSSDVLPSGVRVPAGAKVYVSQWVIHRNPRYYPDPQRFDPERFRPDARSARPRFVYIPFGGGRRLCIGEEFAWLEGVLLLACVARRFRLDLMPGQVIEPDPNVTLRPKRGIRMRLVAR